jgi:hypothetical protein
MLLLNKGGCLQELCLCFDTILESYIENTEGKRRKKELCISFSVL